MKILYLAEFNPDLEKGVYKKIKGQCDAWIHLGHDVDLCVMVSHGKVKESVDHPSYLRFFGDGFLFSLFPKLFFFTFIRKSFNLWGLKRTLNYKEIDIIYFRQTPWYLGLIGLLSKVPSVVEVNTDYKSELEHSMKIKKMFYLSTKEWVMKSLDGLIAVTYELKNLYSRYKIPLATISNGYDYDGVQRANILLKDEVNLVFVSSELPWHGSAKVFELSTVLTQYRFHIVGPIPKGIDEKFLDQENLIFHGVLDNRYLQELYSKMHIGIGSLSLYLYNLTEACPLKTREYLAYGLPVIIGYKDTDFAEEEDFILQIGNYPNNVEDHVEDIEKFVESWKTKRPDSEHIRSIIDYKKKEINRLNFLESIVAG